MIIKQINIQIIVSSFLLVFVFTYCGSPKPKVDDAFDHVKKERTLKKDSSNIIKEIVEEPKKIVVVKKNEIQDEWAKYKNEIEVQIHLNANKIKEIRNNSHLNDNQKRKVKNLESDNNNLRIKIDEYIENEKVNFETFKVSMNHNVNQIGIDLSSLKTSN